MTRDDIIATLRAHQSELRERGVRHAALFGSVARNQQPSAIDIDIDIDIMIELDPEAPVDLFGYVGIVQFLEDLFPVPVDVANRDRLKPLVRPQAERDAVHAF